MTNGGLVDAIVVGAGPGGSSTAYHLARMGRRALLLERHVFPRDKTCGDGLTRAGVRSLGEMGVLEELGGAHTVRSVRFTMRGRGTRSFIYPDDLSPPNAGLVVPRMVLDAILARRAVAAGAELREKTLAHELVIIDGVVRGVAVDHGGHREQLLAPVVVAADGAASRLARQVHGTATSDTAMGFAVRAYFDGLAGLGESLEIVMPILDITDRYLLPSYGWLFPTGPTTANVGVGLFERGEHGNIRELFDRFLATLRDEDGRFAGATQREACTGAPLRFDFAPERCAAPGLLLVGDAAGMVSPFTGEGISFALDSGKLAAEVIDEALAADGDGPPDVSRYPKALRERFSGYFETGRHSARRYRMVWHVLDSTFDNERPIYALTREAVLFPEGVGEPLADALLQDVSAYVGPIWRRVRSELRGVGEVLIEAVRKDWPFLARMSGLQSGSSGTPFRPSLFLILAAEVGVPDRTRTALAGAALELGYLGGLAHVSVDPERPAADPAMQGSFNWGNRFAIMAGDFLLAKAYQLTAAIGPAASRLVADAIARSAEGRTSEIASERDPAFSAASHIDAMEQRIGTLFELPCRLGALIGEVDPAESAALTGFGRAYGTAFGLAEEVLQLEDRQSRFGTVGWTEVSVGRYSLPIREALRRSGAGPSKLPEPEGRMPDQLERAEIRAWVVDSGALDYTLDLVVHYSARARSALAGLPVGEPRQALSGLVSYLEDRLSAPT